MTKKGMEQIPIQVAQELMGLGHDIKACRGWAQLHEKTKEEIMFSLIGARNMLRAARKKLEQCNG